jgi:hypothetical protein
MSVNPPRRFDRIIEAVCARDHRFFEEHLDVRFYVREYVPGELWPHLDLPQATVVLVRLLERGRPGARMRTPVPGHTLEEVRALLADPRVTVFVPSLDGSAMEALE